MAIALQKPILVGGVAVSVVLALTSTIPDWLPDLGEVGFSGAILLGTGLWWWRRGKQKQSVAIAPEIIDRSAVQSEIARAETALEQLAAESDLDTSTQRDRLAQFAPALERQTVRWAILGGKGTGKTALLNALQPLMAREECAIAEAGTLDQQEDDGDILKTALAADGVLFVVNGDLTDSEFQTLEQLHHAKQRIVLVFNRVDRLVPEVRALIGQQLEKRCAALLESEDIMTSAAAPGKIEVRRQQSDGTVQTWEETPAAQIDRLGERLLEILTEERQQLVYATVWRAAIAFQEELKASLNEIRRERALPIIDRYQWVAAAAAFANPVASLDLLATAAINGQMVMDMGKLYRQNFSWEQAQAAAGTLGKLMVQLGVVELTTQTAGSLLKSHAITYVAGGAVQGASAAYLTRLAGLSLIEYFQEQDICIANEEGFNLNRLKQKLQQVFTQNPRTALLQGFIARLTQKQPETNMVATAES